MFISFEGIDGAGKSSHIPWIADLLRSLGKTVTITREPGGTKLGEQLRNLVLTESMQIDTELLLMFAGRHEHVATVIKPALGRGDVVISDRFSDSTYAFQGAGRRVPLTRIKELDMWYGGFKPDLTFLFDLPVEVATKRIDGTRKLDRFEQEQHDFHERVRAQYLDRAAQEPERFRVLDATLPIEDIRNAIEQYILQEFPGSRCMDCQQADLPMLAEPSP